ncbi:MAG: DNA methyltransferase [bacterium]
MKTLQRIIIGDSRLMQEVPDESVHLIVTSPPYWQIKDYGSRNQIGFDQTYEEYINNLNLVWSECHRVLHRGCRLCINIGDQFARSVYYGRYRVIPIRTEIIRFCQTLGFDYMGAIIWQKVTTCNTSGGATVMGSYPYPRNGILRIDYEFILIFKKPGKSPKVSAEIKEQSRLTDEEWNTYFVGHWRFPGEKQDEHLAMFPLELPRRLIKMFTFVGETVLDPFLGSGTSVVAASKLMRNSIGYEINEDFLPVIERRLELTQKEAFLEADFVIEKQRRLEVDFQERIAALPYVFRDGNSLQRIVDPKMFRFGSRIDATQRRHEDLHSVKQVISPVEVLLDDGTMLKLIGVKENPDKRNSAMEFLRKMTKGKRVYFQLCSTQNPTDGYKQGYLYLANKTLLNAQLVKNGLVEVSDTPHRLRERFLRLKEKFTNNISRK